MTWKARVAMVRPAPAGTAVSYSRQAVTGRDTLLAVVTAGDADGYLRQLTNLGRVRIRGKVCPVVGRVCMDMFMVDVTDCSGAAEGTPTSLHYTDDRDMAYGVAGMTITLVALDGEEYFAGIDLDAPAGEQMLMSHDFGFKGNPRMSAKIVWERRSG